MDRVGFIDDSDNIDRFLDNLATNSEGELNDSLLDEIKEKIMSKYNKFNTCENGHYEGFYYKENIQFENINQFNDHFRLGE